MISPRSYCCCHSIYLQLSTTMQPASYSGIVCWVSLCLTPSLLIILYFSKFEFIFICLYHAGSISNKLLKVRGCMNLLQISVQADFFPCVFVFILHTQPSCCLLCHATAGGGRSPFGPNRSCQQTVLTDLLKTDLSWIEYCAMISPIVKM